MSTPTTSLLDEGRLAALGTVRLIAGRRDAPLYFGTELRALIGSLLALVVAVAFSVAVSATMFAMSDDTPAVSSFQSVMITALTFLGQAAGTYGALRMLRRSDRFVPYLVADNWTSFYLTIATAALSIVGVGFDTTLIAVGIVTLITKVNIARLIAELRLTGIVLLLVAQVIGALLIPALFGVTLALTPA